MYSGVFAVDPAIVAEIVAGEKPGVLRDAELLDVDEEAYRSGEFRTRLYGIARVPAIHGKVQVSKQVFEEADEGLAKEEIARFIVEIIHPETLYILGAGTTAEAIAGKIGVKKTLLGVDAIKNGRLVAEDADERTLLGLTEKEKDVRIIVSPIGAQGFVFGRGNQQLSAEVIRRVGIHNIILAATPHKLRETPQSISIPGILRWMKCLAGAFRWYPVTGLPSGRKSTGFPGDDKTNLRSSLVNALLSRGNSHFFHSFIDPSGMIRYAEG